MIEIQNLHFSYGGASSLQLPELTLSDGTLTALVGENGSGKTTLLRLIMGELFPREGAIRIDGLETSRVKKAELATRLSYFPQGRPTPDMSALEVTALGRYPHSRSRLLASKEDRKLAYRALTSVGVEDFADRHMKSLSFGERQRVYLAMQLVQEAQNCLFDEPTNFMDASAKFHMLNTLSDLREQGRCVLCVIHDLTLAMRYADRILVLKEGTLLADGTPDELYESGAIDRAFGIRLCRSVENGERFYGILPEPK